MVVVVVPDDVLLVVDGRVVVVVVEVVEGHVNGPQVNAQLTSPTSHCAIVRASPVLQAPSPWTSHASGYVSWLHCRSPTTNWATTSASPTSTIPSPFTSPQGTAATVVVAVGEAALPKEAVASRKEGERPTARSPRAGKRKASSLPTSPMASRANRPTRSAIGQITDVARPGAGRPSRLCPSVRAAAPRAWCPRRPMVSPDPAPCSLR